jgi:general secretion pathway protein J
MLCRNSKPAGFHPLRSQRGFTLVEILVAIGITVVLLSLLYQTFGATIRATEIVDEETDVYRMAQIGLSIIADEIRSAYWVKDKAATTFFSGSKDALRFTSLSRHRYGEGMEGPELAILNYYLQSQSGELGEPLQVTLMHEEETNSLSLSSNSLQRSELGEGVETFELSYFGDRTWNDSWDAEGQKTLPEAVEIRLSFKGRNGRIHPFRTRIAIPVAAEKGG